MARRTKEQRRADLERQLQELDVKDAEQTKTQIQRLGEKAAALDVRIDKLKIQRAEIDEQIAVLVEKDKASTSSSDAEQV